MKYVFPIVPANNGPIWLAAGIGILLLGVVILLAYTAFSSRNVRFEVAPGGLKISGDLYARFIPDSSLVVDQISSLHLGRDNVRIPTRDGYSILMSVPEPEEFIRVCRDTFNQSG
jgi:hypothetical protein